jgi:hypothetical protein
VWTQKLLLETFLHMIYTYLPDGHHLALYASDDHCHRYPRQHHLRLPLHLVHRVLEHLANQRRMGKTTRPQERMRVAALNMLDGKDGHTSGI